MAVANYRALQAFQAGAALTEACLVKLNNSGQVIPATAAADIVIGVVVEPAPAGEDAGICCECGVKVPVRTSDAIAAGATVGPATGGRVATTTGVSIGIALEAATAADQYITILYTGRTPATA